MNISKTKDEMFMQFALELAKKGNGKTSPNPKVGAVVVKDGKIIGKGYHKKAGLPHAEIYALKEAGPKARGGTLYVTLEPCNNYGRTPPCTLAILSSGIKRVVIGTKDPNPINHNNGIKYLRRKGINVEVGILKDASEKLNEPYNKFIRTGIPWVTVKVAMSLDGKIATRTGSSKWISCDKSRQFVRRLRKEVDAVLIGRNTFLKDKPRLEGVKYKVVLGKGHIDLKIVLKELAKLGIMHVLIEGGGETIASAIEKKLADKLYIFVAPKIIGGRDAITSVEGNGIKNVSQALKLKNMEVKKCDTDLLITASL